MITHLKKLYKAAKLPFLIFVALLFVKYVLIFKTTYGPFLLADELQYAKMAKGIFDGTGYAGTQYPFLYPLVLSISYFFKDHFYDVAKIISIVLSSSIVFPIYAICRLFISEKKSALCTVACAVIPYSLVLSGAMMSEVLYFPLILVAIYLVLREFKTKAYLWDGVLGLVLGMMFITRFITIIILPVFVILWWLKQKDGKNKILRFLILSASAALAISPWVILKLREGETIKHIIGLGIAEKTNEVQLTISNLLSWFALYGFYFVLLLLPVFSFIFFVGFRFDKVKGKIFSLYNRMIVLVVLLSGAFGVAVIRHSWRAYYNVAVKQRIMGRYLIYFIALFIIAAVVTYELVDREKVKNFLNTKLKKIVFLLAGNAVFLALAAGAVLVLFMGKFINVSPGIIALTSSIDLAVLKNALVIYLPIVLVSNLVASLLVFYGKKGLASSVVAYGVIAALLLAYPSYHAVAFDSVELRTYQASIVARELKKEVDPSKVTTVIFTKGVMNLNNYDTESVRNNLIYRLLNTEISAPKVIIADGNLKYNMLGRQGYAIVTESDTIYPEMKLKLKFSFRSVNYLLYQFNDTSGVIRFTPVNAYNTELQAQALPEYEYYVDLRVESPGDFNAAVAKFTPRIPSTSDKEKRIPLLIISDKEIQYFGIKLSKPENKNFWITDDDLVKFTPVDNMDNNIYVIKLNKDGRHLLRFYNNSKSEDINIDEMFVVKDISTLNGIPYTEMRGVYP